MKAHTHTKLLLYSTLLLKMVMYFIVENGAFFAYLDILFRVANIFMKWENGLLDTFWWWFL